MSTKRNSSATRTSPRRRTCTSPHHPPGMTRRPNPYFVDVPLRGQRSRMSLEGLEVDAHDDAPERRPAGFGETGSGEHAGGADVEFSEDGFLRRHGVSLDSA